MTYKEKIPACFGVQDKIFGGHINDTERVRDMIAQSQKENASENDVAKVISNYLNGKSTKNHIKEQLKKFSEAWHWIAN